jgi:hypothetical protein
MIRWLVVLSLLLPLAGTAAEVAGVKLPDTATVAGQTLRLNGAALRQKMFFKIYVAALYLPAKQTTSEQALASPGARRISMTLMRDITAEQLIEALAGGVRQNHTAAEFEKLKPGIEALNRVMTDIGQAKSGSVITLDYVPGTGTQVALNGAAQGAPVPGEDFYRGLMKIWLGQDPVDSGMKKALLGGS